MQSEENGNIWIQQGDSNVQEFVGFYLFSENVDDGESTALVSHPNHTNLFNVSARRRI